MQNAQVHGGPQQQQMNDPQLIQIMKRMREARSTEEKEAVYSDLKKTPHLFTAFLKLTQGNQEQVRAWTFLGFPLNSTFLLQVMMQGSGAQPNWGGMQDGKGQMGQVPPHMQQPFYGQHG